MGQQGAGCYGLAEFESITRWLVLSYELAANAGLLSSNAIL